jgi:hypothetical protein
MAILELYNEDPAHCLLEQKPENRTLSIQGIERSISHSAGLKINGADLVT